MNILKENFIINVQLNQINEYSLNKPCDKVIFIKKKKKTYKYKYIELLKFKHCFRIFNPLVRIFEKNTKI